MSEAQSAWGRPAPESGRLLQTSGKPGRGCLPAPRGRACDRVPRGEQDGCGGGRRAPIHAEGGAASHNRRVSCPGRWTWRSPAAAGGYVARSQAGPPWDRPRGWQRPKDAIKAAVADHQKGRAAGARGPASGPWRRSLPTPTLPLTCCACRKSAAPRAGWLRSPQRTSGPAV